MKISEITAKESTAADAEEKELQEEAQKAAEIIKTQCQPFIREVGGIHYDSLLYRGVRNVRYPYGIVSVRKDRVPMNTSIKYTEMINASLNRLGYKANRTNSVFSIGLKEYAEDYGTVHVMFPIGEFNYTWSPVIADWFVNFHEFRVRFGDMEKFYELKGNPNHPEHKEKFDEMMNDLVRGDDNSLQTALKFHPRHEIMISCDQILLIEAGFYSRVEQVLKDDTGSN